MDRSLVKDGSVTAGGHNPQPGNLSAGQPRDVSRKSADGLSRNMQHSDDTQQADRAGHTGSKQQRDAHTKDSHLAPDTVPRVNVGQKIQLWDSNPNDDQPGDTIPRVGRSKDGQPGDTIPRVGRSKDGQPGNIISLDDSSKDDQPGDIISLDDSSKDDQPGDIISLDGSPKDDQPGNTIPRVGSSKDGQPANIISLDGSSKDDQPGDIISLDDSSKDDQPGDIISLDGSSKDDQPANIIPHDDTPNDDQPANAPQEEEKERGKTALPTLSQSLAALLPPVVFWGVSVIWELLSVFIPRGKGFTERKRGEERETGQRDHQNGDGKPKRGDSKVQETMKDCQAQRPVHDAPQDRGRE